MKKLKSASKRLDDFLNDTVDRHERRLLRSLNALEDKIISLYARIKTDAAGNIKGPKWTLAQAQELHKRMVREFAEQYEKEVEFLSLDYRAIEKEVLIFSRTMEIDSAFLPIDKKMFKALRQQSFKVYETLTGQTVDRIAQGVYDAISAGQSFSLLSRRIAAAITGYKDIAGRPLSKYAGTYAHDSLMSYYRTTHKANADNAGLKDYLYYGDIIRDSRDFCVKRAGKTYSREQIEAMNALQWAGKSGDVMTNCGGYRCRHHWIAVKPEWVKK